MQTSVTIIIKRLILVLLSIVLSYDLRASSLLEDDNRFFLPQNHPIPINETLLFGFFPEVYQIGIYASHQPLAGLTTPINNKAVQEQGKPPGGIAEPANAAPNNALRKQNIDLAHRLQQDQDWFRFTHSLLDNLIEQQTLSDIDLIIKGFKENLNSLDAEIRQRLMPAMDELQRIKRLMDFTSSHLAFLDGNKTIDPHSLDKQIDEFQLENHRLNNGENTPISDNSAGIFAFLFDWPKHLTWTNLLSLLAGFGVVAGCLRAVTFIANRL